MVVRLLDGSSSGPLTKYLRVTIDSCKRWSSEGGNTRGSSPGVDGIQNRL